MTDKPVPVCKLCGSTPDKNMHTTWCNGTEECCHSVIKLKNDEWDRLMDPTADIQRAVLAGVKAGVEAGAVIANDHTPTKHASTLSAFVTGDMIERAIRNLSPDDILKRL